MNEVDQQQALATFLQLVQIDSPSGDEAAVAAFLVTALERAGASVTRDAIGNVIGRRPGKGSGASMAPLLLCAHMDTVQPGIGVQPVVEAGLIRSSGTTILGADDKAGITAILEALRRTYERAPHCRPVEIVFTVQEETGLTGAKNLDLSTLQARQAVVLDSNGPVGTIITRAPASNHIEATIYGRAAHAGVAPERGINAIQIAARALAPMRLGRIDPETTANIGLISGGTATNIVPEQVVLKGETRSRDEAKLEAQTQHMVGLIRQAAADAGGRADVSVVRSYGAINVPESSPLVAEVGAAMRRCGVEPQLGATGGGSDANVLHAAGIEALNLGLGFENVHSVQESIPLAALYDICAVVTALLSGEAERAADR